MKLPDPVLCKKIDSVLRNMMPFSVMRKWVAGGGGGGAPPTFNVSTMKTGGSPTAGITTTGGSASVMIVMISGSSGDTPTITDNKGNTWPATLVSATGPLGEKISCYAIAAGSGGAGHVITVTGGSSVDVIFFVEYLASTGFEVQNAVQDASAPFDISTSATTTVANSILVTGGIGSSVAVTTTASISPGAIISQESDYATYWAGAFGSFTVTTTGTKTTTWSYSPTAGSASIMCIICVKGT